MPTRKQQLQTKINTNLETGTNITAIRHRDVESSIMNAAIPVNRGWFTGLDVQGASVGTNLDCSGDITSAILITVVDYSTINVFFAESMLNTNYMIRIHIESQGVNPFNDAAILYPIFKVITANNAYISIREPFTSIQNLKFHLEVVSLDY
jgi:hypothetical protein